MRTAMEPRLRFLALINNLRKMDNSKSLSHGSSDGAVSPVSVSSSAVAARVTGLVL